MNSWQFFLLLLFSLPLLSASLASLLALFLLLSRPLSLSLVNLSPDCCCFFFRWCSVARVFIVFVRFLRSERCTATVAGSMKKSPSFRIQKSGIPLVISLFSVNVTTSVCIPFYRCGSSFGINFRFNLNWLFFFSTGWQPKNRENNRSEKKTKKKKIYQHTFLV